MIKLTKVHFVSEFHCLKGRMEIISDGVRGCVVSSRIECIKLTQNIGKHVIVQWRIGGFLFVYCCFGCLSKIKVIK